MQHATQIRGFSLFVIAAVLFVQGCASSGPKPYKPLNSVMTIAVDDRVTLPPKVFYLSAGQAWGQGVGGLIGGSIAAANGPDEDLGRYLQGKGIAMDQILVQEAKDIINKSGRLQIVDDPKQADVVLRFAITKYGFIAKNVLSGKLKTILRVETKVSDRNGKTIFSDEDNNDSEHVQYSLKEFLAEPERIRAGFHEVANQAADDQISGLLDEIGDFRLPPAAN